MSPPAVLRLMKPCTPNVEGNMYENTFQNFGNATVGQEQPVRNRHIGEIARNSRNTDSLLVIRVLQLMAKNTQSVTKNSRSARISPKLPLCGIPNIAGTMNAMYIPMPRYSSQ